jgi:hypothetical protein
MVESALARKLLMKRGMILRLFDAPAGYGEMLEPLPDATNITLDLPADFVPFFAASKSDLETRFPDAL